MKISDAEIEDEIENLLPRLALPDIGSVIEVMRELADNIVKKQDFNLVADQQKRIEELEAHVERSRNEIVFGLNHYIDAGYERMAAIAKETPTQSLAHIQREAMQNCMEICEGVCGRKHIRGYRLIANDCAEAIKKKMEELDND